MAKTATVTQTTEIEQPSSGKDLTQYKYGDLKTQHKTVSGVFRYLNDQGLTKGEIAKVTGKRYQHVRNVLITPVKNPTK